MRIEHVAMYARDLEGVKNFFQQYFEAKADALYHNRSTGFKSYFLSFADGAKLEIMTRPGLEEAPGAKAHCGYIHMAMSVGSEEKVRELTELLRRDGFTIVSGPRRTGDGYYESCVLGPEDNLIEITI